MRNLLFICLFCFSHIALAGTGVYINDQELGQDEVNQLAQAYQSPIAAGEYWYDNKTGAWGLKCGPGIAIGVADLDLGGALKADASCGNTGVFVNGRQLHVLDLMALQALAGTIAPGRYWMDAELNAGLEGGPALVNYKVLMTQQQIQYGQTYDHSYDSGYGSGYDQSAEQNLDMGGDDHFWSTGYSAGNSSADGSQGYVSVPGYGPVGYGY